jgi:polysaccharide export outer membrane protein
MTPAVAADDRKIGVPMSKQNRMIPAKLRKKTLHFSAFLILCSLSYGQASQRIAHSETAQQRTRPPELSELARQNLSHVAASSVQIREVLVKDPGLLVELKRWVAKESADNGQIVEDSDLTDQAIFDRLDQDVEFRSVATRLLQRYGYLLPAPNPNSSYGKEQEYVLKERARRLVQIEEQENTQSLKPERNNQEQSERLAACDPQRDRDCAASEPASRPSNRQRTSQPQDIEPFSLPEDLSPSPYLQPSPSPSSSGTLRTGLSLDGFGQEDQSSASLFELASSSKSWSGIPSDLQNPANAINSQWEGQISEGIRSSYNSKAGSQDLTARSDIREPSGRSVWKRERPIQREEDVNPVKMVRPANPYSDIPSLYDMYVQAAAWQRPAERFGLDVFRNAMNQPDLVPMDLPVGPDYVVGSGDSLSIDLWGSVSQRLIRVVDREGRVSLPDTAPLLVSGRSLGDVQLDIQHALRSVFRDVSADVSVSRLRTVRVYVVGDVAQPGAYDISSLSTPLNALFAAGGVTPRGSLRQLRHFRGKQLIEQVDAYDLLLHGVRSDMQRLENGDSLLVPTIGPQVTVDGMVRRPAIYELSGEKSLAEVLQLAGGILPTAALRHIEVQRVDAHEKRTMLSLDVTGTNSPEIDKQLQAFDIQDGDQVHIFPIAAYNEDAIYLQGHVLRPGRYSYKQGMKLTDLISSYDDILPEPAPHYAEIVRLNPPDFHPSVESFDLAAALANPASAPSLEPLDTVRIFSRFDFEAPPQVWIGGEVRTPGTYRTSGQARLRDAIYLAGGITPDASLDSAQLFRAQPDGTMKILSVDLREALAGNPVDNIILQPRDRLLIHRTMERVDAPTVDIKGEVAKPGRYPLTSNMRVDDLVRVAGGMKRSAFADTADLTRFAASTGSNQRIEVKLSAALSGDADENVPLRNGDVLAIRQIPQWNDLGSSVTVKGEVQHPGTYGLEPGERLSSVLKRCNGFTSQAYPYGAVLLRQEVRQLELKSHLELVNRLKSEEVYLKALPESDTDQKEAKLTAIAQTDTAMQQLEATAPVGRVVIHIPSDLKRMAKTPADVPLRDGDVLIIPKKTNYVVVSGQVFNPTAVSYLPGRSAKWYLSQAGGLTGVADKSGVFVIRADGSVLAAKNNSGFWHGDPLSAVLKPGDSIVVPEKAPKIAPRNFTNLMSAASVASSVALAVAYIHP